VLNVLWIIASFLFALMLLVSVHEAGHFLVAKFFKVKVLRFSFGFGKVLFSKIDKSGTEFAFSLLPFGGYVKMLDERIMPVSVAELPYAFNQKPLYQRFLIVLAGPFFNFLLAILIYWIVFIVGLQQLAPKVGQIIPASIAAKAGIVPQDIFKEIDGKSVYSWADVSLAFIKHIGEETSLSVTVESADAQLAKKSLNLSTWTYRGDDMNVLDSVGIRPYYPPIATNIARVLPDSPAEKAGLHSGEKVIALDNHPMNDWQSLTDYLQDKAGKRVTFTTLQSGKVRKVSVLVGTHQFSSGMTMGFVGIESERLPLPKTLFLTERYSPVIAFQKSLVKSYDVSLTTLRLFFKIISGSLSYKSISGPIGIAQGAGFSSEQGLIPYLEFLGLLSISLGVINLLPLPLLDGGYLFFYLIEAVRRKPISKQQEDLMLRLGIFLLLSIMVVAIYNDLSRLGL
jgi:regulator of sigma E protease